MSEPITDAEWTAFQQATCHHNSADGIDQTPLDDPEKVWRCVGCSWEFKSVPEPGRPWQVRLVPAHINHSRSEENPDAVADR